MKLYVELRLNPIDDISVTPQFKKTGGLSEPFYCSTLYAFLQMTFNSHFLFYSKILKLVNHS